MDINIRKAILHNIKENSRDQLEATITDAIQDGQEKMLPGLGFLFKHNWKQSDEQEKVEMLEALEKGVKETTI